MIPILLQVSNVGESYKNRNFDNVKDTTVIEFLINRIKGSCDCKIVIATSNREEDRVFIELAKKHNLEIYCGEYKNVLLRMREAINGWNVDSFVRIFANYPFLDIKQLQLLYNNHVQANYEYSYNEHQNGVLWGTGCEVFSTDFINRLCDLELQDFQRETISYYLRQNEDKLKVQKGTFKKQRPSYKLFLETKKDLEVIQEIAENIDIIDNEHIIDYLNHHKVLSKYNLDAPVKEVGMEKLFLHANKVSTILNEDEVDISYPVSVELTLTNRCNLNCVYCSDMMLRQRQGLEETLDKDTLFKLFEDLAEGGTKGIVLEGGGEPSLYPSFNEIVRYAKRVGIAVGLITNGTVRLEEDILNQFEWIRVSLDASTADEYFELKGVNCFERVLSNISYYAKHCETVGIGYVVTNKNISKIEALVMRLREFGASYIQLRPVVDCDELYPKDIDLNYLKFYQTMKFGVTVDGMEENAQGGNHTLPCTAHSITNVISGDGSVYLCGRLNIYDWLKPIGNITERSFKAIWEGEERKKQSDMVRDAKFCTANCPQCRVSKFNELLYKVNTIKSKHFI